MAKEKRGMMFVLSSPSGAGKTTLTKKIAENKSEQDLTISNLQKSEKEANEINRKLKLQEVRLSEIREEKIRIEGIIATHNETLKQIFDLINIFHLKIFNSHQVTEACAHNNAWIVDSLGLLATSG